MIHKTTIIEEGVQIGKNVQIGPYCIIGKGAHIGDNVRIRSHVVTEGRVIIGEGVSINSFASLSYPQTLKYNGEDSAIIIGKNTTIREYVTIQHGTEHGRMKTVIGDDCLLMVGVHVAHNCIVGNNVILANYASLAGHVEIGDFAIIGGLSAVQQFCRVGPHTMIGGLSGIDKDVVPYGLAANKRASLEGINLVGMKRRGFDTKETIQASKATKILFNSDSDLVFDERVKQVKEQFKDNNIVQQIIKFVESDNSRSFCKFE
ncbi:MAG: hypothetical protein DGJ47_000674 [Rickettsiaceae bacterium]